MQNLGTGSWPFRQHRRHPESTAVRYQGGSMTYSDVYRRATKLANSFRAAGLEPGARVAYLGRNHPSYVVAMFATHMAAAIFVPLNFRLTAPELDYVLGQSGATWLIYAEDCAEAVARLGGYRGRRLELSDGTGTGQGFEEFLDAGGDELLDLPVALEDPALILYTSGTTGRPKGAVLTHQNLVFNVMNLLIDDDVREDEVTLVAAPLFHVAALDQLLLPTYVKGACCLLVPAWDVDACFDAIEDDGVTWIFGVTAMLAGLAKSPRWETTDLSSLRHVMSGGAPIPPALIRTYQDRGVTFCQGYGMTETAPGATFIGGREGIAKAGTAGQPCFFADIRVVRPDMTDAGVGEPGEVLVSGPSVTPGYWHDDEATAAAFSGGEWFHSGDLATVDEDGYLTIVDRVKDMYISGGENVYPAEIEAAAFANPAVLECSVVGVPDPTWGEVGAAFVVVRRGHDLDADGLRAFLRERLAHYKVPAYITVVDELPRTASGKVTKSVLRKRFRDDRG